MPTKILRKILAHKLYIGFIFFYSLLAVKSYDKYAFSNYEIDYYNTGVIFLNKYLKQNLTPLSTPSLTTQHSQYSFYPALLVLIHGDNLMVYRFVNLLIPLIMLSLVYYLFYTKYKLPLFSITAIIILVLSPVLSGISAIDPKNTFVMTVFMSAWLFVLIQNSSSSIFHDSKLASSVIIGLLFGLSQASNFFGFLLWLFWIFLEIHNLIFRYEKTSFSGVFVHIKTFLFKLFVSVIVYLLVILITWPSFAGNLYENIQNFKSTSVYFAGDRSEESLPYLFMIIFSAVPVVIILFSIIGFFFNLFKLKDYYLSGINFLLVSLIAAFVIMKPNISFPSNNFLFVYPLIIISSFLTFLEIYYFIMKNKYSRLFVIIGIGYLSTVFFYTFQLFPYQYSYVNELAASSSKIKTYINYDPDPLNLNHKQSIELLSDINRGVDKKVYTCEKSFSYDYFANANIKFTDKSSQADFIICPYTIFDIEPIKEIRVNNQVVNKIYSISK